MIYILDTQIALWAVYDYERIPKDICNFIEDEDNEIYYSLVSAWEVEIKHNIGKLQMSAKDFIDGCECVGFNPLPIKKKHILGLSEIPSKDNHKDPFDRLLISQAKQEQAKLLTVDEKILSYQL